MSSYQFPNQETVLVPDGQGLGPNPEKNIKAEDERPKNADEQVEVKGATMPASRRRYNMGEDIGDSAGLAVIEQKHVIPTTGKRIPTTKKEYWTFCLFYFSLNGAPIGGNGGALRQALLSLNFPGGYLNWGGQNFPINSYLLDLTGIQFGVQLVTLLVIGPYADYGTWRPWILVGSQTLLYICQFALCGISKPSQWQAANVLYIMGTLAANIANSFYAAFFPTIVRDLPKIIESEREVRMGVKDPEEHAKLDSYERSRLYNLVNITGSALVVFFYAIAVGISAGVGYKTQKQLITSYRVLMGYFGAITVLCTVPFFIYMAKRPGMSLPAGTSWLTVGPKQVWQAIKSIRRLKQCMLYLLAWFLLQEMGGTAGNIQGILQNEIINYDPLVLNAMGLVADLAGGSGTVFMYLLQRKYRFSVKAGVFYGAVMHCFPSLWGFIGAFTHGIGFHHVWEFWLFTCWNFQTAAWGAYATTQISEVVPAPKCFLFFALFNTVSKTSGFIGPFITSAIIKRAGGRTNFAYIFLLPLGLLGVLVLYFVNNDKAKVDSARFLEHEAAEIYSQEQRDAHRVNEKAEGLEDEGVA